MNSSRSSEVLPEPDGPVRKWNEPGRKWNVTSCSTSLPRSYRNPIAFSLITREALVPSGSRGSLPSIAAGGKWDQWSGLWRTDGARAHRLDAVSIPTRVRQAPQSVLGFDASKLALAGRLSPLRAAKEGMMARILLADDDAATRDLVTRALATGRPHRRPANQDGAEALEKLQERADRLRPADHGRADAGARRHRARRAGVGWHAPSCASS